MNTRTSETQTPISLWIVEDDTMFRQELVDMLDDIENISCTGEFGDVESFEHFIANKDDLLLPDIILMDINLPGINGIEETRLLKVRYPDLIIIMLTLYDDGQTIYDALEAGASGYLLKETSDEKIVGAIYEAIEGGMLMPGRVAEKVLGHFNKLPPQNEYNLTGREKDVLVEMCNGLTLKKIGATLYIAEDTVSSHVKQIYKKLQVKSGREAVAKAFRKKLVR